MAAFKELMRTGSVSEAARNLNRTQPAVSHTIAALEDDLGMKLFLRRKGRLHPVPEAHYLLEECEFLLNRVEMLGQNVSRIKAMDRGELRVASMPGPSTFWFPHLVARHVGDRADVKATIQARTTEAVIQLVSSQQYDLGLADYEPNHAIERALSKVEVFLFDCLCALPAGDPLAEKNAITTSDLSGRPLGCLFEEHRIFKQLRQVFASTGDRLNVRFQSQSFIQLLTFVESGHALAVVDPLTVEAYRIYSAAAERIVFRPLTPAIEFGVIKLTPSYRPASLLATSFAELVTEELLRIGARRGDSAQS